MKTHRVGYIITMNRISAVSNTTISHIIVIPA